MKPQGTNPRTLTLIAMLSALSAVLMSINIPLPIFPGFLKFDIAEFPGLFAGFFLGPGAAALVVILKNLLKLVLQGTETMYIGEIMNVIGSLGFTLPAAILYRRHKDAGGARMALISSTLVGSMLAVFLNLLIGFPMYAAVFGLQIDAIIGMGAAVNPMISNLLTMLLFGILPFNLLKLGATSLVTWWMYKRIGKYLRSLVGLRTKHPAKAVQ